jgi:Domain of unknown function (DUF4282)
VENGSCRNGLTNSLGDAMTERPSSQGQPDDWSNSAYGAAETRAFQVPDPGASAQGGYGSGASTPGGYGSAATTPGGYGSGASTPGGYGSGASTPGGYGSGASTPSGYGSAAGTPGGYGSGVGGPAVGTPQHSAPGRSAAESKGFLAALFDFSFNSFITTTVIRVIYILVTIIIFLEALAFTFVAFRANALFGILTLVIGDPLFIIIAMAMWRLILEFFVVIFRIHDDIRVIRERGDLR